jgi:hypothetical protein
MDGSQDWCLQCGSGAPDSLGKRSPSWGATAAVLAGVAILLAGAATAAYAALSKSNSGSRAATIAQIPAPAAAAPVTPAAPTTPTGKLGTPTTIKPSVPLGTVKPPKIPLTAATPRIAQTVPALKSASGTSTPAVAPKTGESTTPAETQEAILLDTNAAATYNPYGYPSPNFGDPSLAIDGDTSTGWTAQVEPAVAPRMAEGVVIDLKSSQKLSALDLSTSTPGMTVQVYGAAGSALPTSITDPAWVALTPSLLQKKKHTRLKFGGSTKASQLAAKKAYRYVVLWISRAPAASVGTAQTPGHVSVDELELFPASK